MPLKILVSAFACGSNWGSEVGMGWNWVTSLANVCQLTVITEKGFQENIEANIVKLNLKYSPIFYYIDIGEKGRALFWKQGDWKFYAYYNKWQKDALSLAKNLTSNKMFDLIHQLNLIGYREPGYLWKIEIPFVWGPIGGHVQFPWNYLKILGFKSAVYYSLKNIINTMQIYTSPRVRKATQKSAALITATREGQFLTNKVFKKKSYLLNETGTNISESILHEKNKTFSIAWCGIFEGRKALPLVLNALSLITDCDNIKLHIVGDGIEAYTWKSLAEELGVQNKCIWYGRITHPEALEVMRKASIFIFSSLQEGTSTVILEAIENALPVICHDCCGFGAVINDSCGIKIPIKSPQASIYGIKRAIESLYHNPDILEKLRNGALKRSHGLCWEKKVITMLNIYQKVLSER